MDALFGVVGVLLLVVSIISVVIFGLLLAVKKNNSKKNYKRKLRNSSILFVISIVLIIIAGSLSPSENSSSKKDETTSSKTVEKKEKKSVAYTYDKAETKADRNGDFLVKIEVKDGYTPEIVKGANVTLKKKDDHHYLLSGTVDKKEQSATYKLSFTANDDQQTMNLTIDNALAKKAYVQKQIAEAKKKVKETALKNENTLSYGMLNKSQDKYVGKPYHITKGHVMQAMEDNGKTTLLVQLTDKGYGIWDDIIAVYYPNTTDAVDSDFVEIWGTLGQKWNYTTKIGGSNSVPTMKADTIKVIGHSK
ncbi:MULTISPECIES: hypothetical protein [unclassified Rummeliibacillus]|uniref:hypothetical protein n=1 Tax=unclassified Rummeliibacillus TaxID=2622809 RepID=UPI000E674AF7|nr:MULTISPECIES: hypothetical protein [unclassified Rummeliibacillus]RIJ62909.1 hypothetical protein D1606_17730 [Rummeliibacillus sp. POC4]RPJ94195.1 hypothetical protein CW357_16610 [Rummeliibacillus sp. TYF005]